MIRVSLFSKLIYDRHTTEMTWQGKSVLSFFCRNEQAVEYGVLQFRVCMVYFDTLQ